MSEHFTKEEVNNEIPKAIGIVKAAIMKASWPDRDSNVWVSHKQAAVFIESDLASVYNTLPEHDRISPAGTIRKRMSDISSVMKMDLVQKSQDADLKGIKHMNVREIPDEFYEHVAISAFRTKTRASTNKTDGDTAETVEAQEAVKNQTSEQQADTVASVEQKANSRGFEIENLFKTLNDLIAQRNAASLDVTKLENDRTANIQNVLDDALKIIARKNEIIDNNIREAKKVRDDREAKISALLVRLQNGGGSSVV